VVAQAPTIPDFSGLGNCESSCSGFSALENCVNSNATTEADLTSEENCMCKIYEQVIPGVSLL
jgi:hypothetical protein